MFSGDLSTEKKTGTRVGNILALVVGMEALVITTTAAGALGLAYGIQKAALNLLFRMMSIGQQAQSTSNRYA